MLFSKNEQSKIITKKKGINLKKRDEKAKSLFGRLAFYFLLVMYFPVLVYVLLFSPFLEINKVDISGNTTLAKSDIMAKINELRSGKHFGLIPKNNYLLLSREKLSQGLIDEFKKIKSVEIKKTFPDSLGIAITEREALIVWCLSQGAGAPDDSCYILDEHGYAFTPTNLDAPEVRENNLIQVNDSGTRPVEIGKRVISEDRVFFLVALRKGIESMSEIRITNEWRTPSSIAQEVEVMTDEGWRIIFSSEIKPEKSIRTLETFLSEEIGEEKRKDLEYVDLRVENKVFYKLKNEEKKDDEENKKDDQPLKDEEKEVD